MSQDTPNLCVTITFTAFFMIKYAAMGKWNRLKTRVFKTVQYPEKRFFITYSMFY